jgi:putative tryptophan/tyrosine transport system substrate-binding protein
MMRAPIQRREFITLLGGAAAAWPLAAGAQQPGRVWRIGFIAGGERPVSIEAGFYGGFLQGMRELGYVEGKDIVIEWRFAEGRYELLPGLAAEIVRLKVDVIVSAANEGHPVVQRATGTIPIVMTASVDPVGRGIIASLARPGGNITGLASSNDDSAPKQLELLATAVPNVARVGVLVNPRNGGSLAVLKSVQAAGQQARLSIIPVEASNVREVESGFATLTRERVGVLLATPDAFFNAQRQRITELALTHRLPTMFSRREFVDVGGMMSYGESLAEFYRRSATYVDKIFKGAKPADLPVEQPTRFHLVINRKTAAALGVTIPPVLYIFADEVIE